MIVLYFLCNCLLVTLTTTYQMLLISRTASICRPRFFLIFSSVVGAVLWTLNNYLLAPGAANLDTVIILFLLLMPPLFANKGSRLKAFFLMSVFLGIQIAVMYIVALFAFPLAEQLGYSPIILVDKYTSFGNAIMTVLCFCINAPLCYLSARLIDRFFSRKKMSVWLLCFLPIPISQAILINLLNRVIPLAGGFGNISAAFKLAILLSITADICFFIGASRIQQSQDLKEQIRIAREHLDIQAGYYRQMQENILTINEIRHDLSNQLQAAYYLLEQGESGWVRNQLDHLQDSIQNRVGPKFCANLMVDAVLSEKSKRCQEQGILLTVNANLPAELPLESSHLCSAFSNLLDNSIHAVSNGTTGKKEITLETTLRSSCLMIRCENPVSNQVSGRVSGDPMRIHGLGLEILNRIAKIHSGSFETTQKNGLFTATLILPFPDTDRDR